MLTHEAASRQVEDLFLLDRAIEVPVEVFQRPLLTKGRGRGAAIDQSLLPHRQLILQNQFQELDMVESVGLGFL